MKCKFPVPLKVGFSSNGLGWKTKWNQYDFRHEWNPVISFVFFGYQIAVTFYHEHSSHYWESWLCYEYASDKKRSKRKRIAFCRRKCPQTWRSLGKDGKDDVVTNYWDLILKPNYSINHICEGFGFIAIGKTEDDERVLAIPNYEDNTMTWKS